MTSFWDRLLRSNPKPQDEAPLHPIELPRCPRALYAVGDIHGCAQLYTDLEAQIFADAKALDTSPVILTLGDVVDRGPDSAGVIDILSDAPATGTRHCLMGNHEQMMLEFLDDPQPDHRWLEFGGWETLESYGIYRHALPKGARAGARHLRMAIDSSVPDAHLEFLRGLVPYILAPHAAFVHAGLDPEHPLEAQVPSSLFWADPREIPLPQKGWPRLIHGHVVSEDVDIAPHRIGVDTGAYHSGCLSAVRLYCPICHPGSEEPVKILKSAD